MYEIRNYRIDSLRSCALRFHHSLLLRDAEGIQALDTLAASPRGAVPGGTGSFLAVSGAVRLPGISLRDWLDRYQVLPASFGFDRRPVGAA